MLFKQIERVSANIFVGVSCAIYFMILSWLFLDVFIEDIQELVPRCMLFAYDIVLVGESREKINGKLELWRQALLAHDFRFELK